MHSLTPQHVTGSVDDPRVQAVVAHAVALIEDRFRVILVARDTLAVALGPKGVADLRA